MAISDFIEPAIKDYATQATATYSAPIDTTKFTGRQFVAGEDPLQTQAINIAQQGVGSYQPFLSAAQTAQQQGAGALGQSAQAIGGLGAYQTAAGNIATGAAGMTGPQAYQPFMSPYQTQVIDATLSEYDKQGLAGQQYGLSNFQRQSMGADVSALGSLGALRQGQQQALLGADQQAAQTAAYEPYGRLSQYGNTLTGLAGGVSGQQYAEPQQASPFSTALSTALGVGGLYGKIFK